MENYRDFKPKGARLSGPEKTTLFEKGFAWCNGCEKSLPIDDFGKDKTTKFGLESRCKECRRKYAENRRRDFPEETKKIRRDSRNRNKEFYNQVIKEWRFENRDKINNYRRVKYKEDPLYKMQIACRNMVKKMFKSIGSEKDVKTHKVLGYAAKDLKLHIEQQFTDGMTWDNYGEWHIDHIIPISEAKTFIKGLQLSQLTNLQPLWAEENIRKSNIINEEEKGNEDFRRKESKD